MSADKDIPATKDDVQNLTHEMRDNFEELNRLISDSFTDVQKDIGSLKHDVGELKHDVGELKHDVGELKHDVGELQLGQIRIEHKLDATISRADEHALRITKLEQKAA